MKNRLLLTESRRMLDALKLLDDQRVSVVEEVKPLRRAAGVGEHGHKAMYLTAVFLNAATCSGLIFMLLVVVTPALASCF
uniref:Uncharacterized protein n=1 Tax=Oryza nivara TaxID=4536 RepID=A0A0E0I5T8_ORYNI